MANIFPNSFESAKACVTRIAPASSWGKSVLVVSSFDKNVDSSYAAISFINESLFDLSFQTCHAEALISKWNDAPEKVSAVDLCSQLMKVFEFNDVSDGHLCSALLVAAALADVPNDFPYHNDLHFKKVVLHTARMIAAHNFIFDGGPNVFNKESIATLLIAACIHDLGHEGRGNIIDRQYHIAKTEMHSFALAEPFLVGAGVSEDMLSDIKVMLIGTDASPFGDPISPSQQVRRAYSYHFGDEEGGDLNLADELSCLEARDDLALKCMILHEADLMNSIGIDYGMTVQESVAVSKEIGGDATPEATLLFLEKTCCNELYTDCGRYLGQKNFDVIKTKIMADYEDGNKVYRS